MNTSKHISFPVVPGDTIRIGGGGDRPQKTINGTSDGQGDLRNGHGRREIPRH